jgi:hypothetical protein
MLHNFRVNAGLKPKAPVYGGWESEAIWADIKCHSHTLGHYLSACALAYPAEDYRHPPRSPARPSHQPSVWTYTPSRQGVRHAGRATSGRARPDRKPDTPIFSHRAEPCS